MTNSKIKLFAILIVPFALQAAAINYNQQLLDTAKFNNLEQVKEALKHGADVNFVDPDYEKYTPLHYAASYGHTEAVNALILAKATIDARNNGQSTPLHFAAGYGHTEVVNALIKANATIDSRNNYQRTPLHFAAINGRIEAVNTLIKAKATIDARNNVQWTPLHYAARYGYTEVVNALLDVGSNATLLDKDNKTVFHLIAKSYMPQNKKDQLEKIIKDHQIYQSLMLIEVPKLFITQYDQLKIPEPIAKLITQYAFGICETEKNNKGDNNDKL